MKYEKFKSQWEKETNIDGLTFTEIANKYGVDKRTVSSYVVKDRFSYVDCQVLFWFMVYLSPAKTAKELDIPVSKVISLLQNSLKDVKYSLLFRSNGLGAIGDYLRQNRKQIPVLKDELIKKLPRMIEIQEKQVVNCSSDRVRGKISHTDTLFPFKEEIAKDVREYGVSDLFDAEIECICRDYYSGNLDTVLSSKVNNSLNSLSTVGALHSVCEAKDYEDALRRIPAEHRVTLNAYYGELVVGTVKDVSDAQVSLRRILERNLQEFLR
jgi:hypothetical protein